MGNIFMVNTYISFPVLIIYSIEPKFGPKSETAIYKHVSWYMKLQVNIFFCQ